MIFVEQALGRHEFEDVDPVKRPAVRLRAGTELVLGLRKRNVKRALSRRGARSKKLRSNGRLAGSGAPLEQEQSPARKTTRSDVVQAVDSEFGFGIFGHA